MTYTVKEIFFTLQGEGANAGRPAVFCRFTGCNLWNGREADRARAICQFCDTDFIGTNGPEGGRFDTAEELAEIILSKWPNNGTRHRFVVCTGGEPLLQLDNSLINALHARGFEVAIETNGTMRAPGAVDWICVSPKGGAEIVLRWGNELKLVYPQQGVNPEIFEDLRFDYLFLQPMDGPSAAENTRAAIDYCLAHPRWRLSLQTHKFVGIR